MANPEVEYAKRRAGGWQEVTSPDGRITMYVSPHGERLSKQEFADRYPQGAGSPDYLAHMGFNDIMTGRAAAPITNGDPNIKAGIVLTPGQTQRERFWGPQSRDRARPSTMFHEADESLAKSRSTLGEMERNGWKAGADSAKRSVQYDSARRADAYRSYKRTENPDVPANITSEEMDLISRATDRSRPLDFPDRRFRDVEEGPWRPIDRQPRTPVPRRSAAELQERIQGGRDAAIKNTMKPERDVRKMSQADLDDLERLYEQWVDSHLK